MSTTSPRITVILPVYRHSHLLARCLDSVLAQTIPPQIIVVNDGSPDDVDAAIKPYLDRVTYRKLDRNRGANVARNIALREATGEFVLISDADLIMRPDMLETLLRALETHPEASYAYGKFRYGWKLFPSMPFDDAALRRFNFVSMMSLVRRADHPGFDESIKRFQDWDVWLTMLAQGKRGVFVDVELFRILETGGRFNISSRWFPSFLYRLPWPVFGWTPSVIQKYLDAKRVLFEKHKL